MTLLRPKIDLEEGLPVLRVSLHHNTKKTPGWQISIPLFSGPEQVKARPSKVCSESVDAYVLHKLNVDREAVG
jgi:hypothetical protein